MIDATLQRAVRGFFLSVALSTILWIAIAIPIVQLAH